MTVSRPETIDLILTKMARGDDDDLQDIRFMLAQGSLNRDQLEAAFARAFTPGVPETQELFNLTRPNFLALAGR